MAKANLWSLKKLVKKKWQWFYKIRHLMMRVSFARRRIFTLLQAEHDNNRTNFPYWKYARFDLELLVDEKRLSDLQNKTGYHSFILCHFVGDLDTLKTLYRHIVLSVEEHCITLTRLAYPCRYGGVIPIFHDLCLAFHSCFIKCFFHARFGHLFCSLVHTWLSSENLANFANVVHNEGSALDNYWRFINGTVRAYCIMDGNQGVVYNGHKRVYVLFLCYHQEKTLKFLGLIIKLPQFYFRKFNFLQLTLLHYNNTRLQLRIWIEHLAS